jgi:GNAT superfamily N-acetyltransferase
MGKFPKLTLIDVTAGNVAQEGFFCRMTRMKTEGNQRTLAWLRQRLAEGMRVKIIARPGRGFIEYVPGEYAWRPVEAKGYMFIQCLWVVGKTQGQGHGQFLLDTCIRDARDAGCRGVAMVTNEGNFLAGSGLLEKNGFACVDKAPQGFRLMALKFKKAKSPAFIPNLESRLKGLGKGLVVLRSDQCPYNEDAVRILGESAAAMGVPFREMALDTLEKLRTLSPCAYGTFHLVYNEELLSYHYLTPRLLKKKIVQL